ncbi:MAG TPA: hypothetical protein VMR51_03570 [Patescibacteria group bacterium]|nr:hypothetical protein [Patescibacteria group bacterium]
MFVCDNPDGQTDEQQEQKWRRTVREPEVPRCRVHMPGREDHYYCGHKHNQGYNRGEDKKHVAHLNSLFAGKDRDGVSPSIFVVLLYHKI